ncbi:hypothetical protein SAMN02800694_2818 [Luteibacter sp. UNCMF331Sha3.1]|uniref:hypothetical protein n=1 Tax=Luteibacter sp. UNCMF331Sha3.1 TaxID=1502760 RepID=UPI0008D4F782|nr:hypothetical protein [Luteibacter sp. UNCMF331Sha3.1]SEN11617.1 hypothetical protein SAMN02800694_2818 [Luteibacter sp. UNCMF331Sha3.1]
MTALNTLTIVHTLLSLIALLLGLGVVAALVQGTERPRLVNWFLVTAVLTTLTGFFFPFNGFTPAIGVGIVSSVVLAVALFARFGKARRGGWRHADTVGLLLTEYFLVFVGIAQAFLKVPALHAIAPTGMETPFKVSQAVLLTATVIVGFLAVRRGRAVATSRPPLRSAR